MQLWFHAFMGLSSTDRSVDEEQRNQFFSVSPFPNRGVKDSLGIQLVVSGEIEQPFGFSLPSLAEHISQPALSGGNHQPTPAPVTKAVIVLFAIQIGHSREDFLTEESGVVFRASVNLQ